MHSDSERRSGSVPRSGSARGALGLIAVAALAPMALTACAAPETRFVTSGEHDAVVEVPWSWTRITHDDVLEALPQKPTAEQSQVPEGTFIEYYDGAARPDPEHVFADAVEAPVVLLRTSAVAEEQRALLTLDSLRNLFRPVTAEARAMQDQSQQLQGLPPRPFQLLSDEQITTRTSRGVHLVYRTGEGASAEVYDQVATSDAEHERFQLLLVYCSQSCFSRYRPQIEAVADSFTAKKP